MNTKTLINPTVKAAIDALFDHDSIAWFALFTPGAELYDDGNKQDLTKWSHRAFESNEYFTAIDRIENEGNDIYGRYHSDQWGDFKTYFKFHINNEKLDKLEVGQVNY